MFAIDAQISPGEAGGSETHIPLQIHALAKHSRERFLVIGSTDDDEGLRPLLGDNMELIAYPVRYAWFKAGAFPMSANANDALLRAHGVEVVHFPYPQHFATGLPFVYEPWGLPHRHFPEFFQAGEPEWMDALMRGGCENAAMVITATQWAKRDISRAYGLPPSKVAVLPRNPIFKRSSPSGAADTDLAGLPEDFALYPSAAWPHKNHVGLLQAMALLRDEHGLRLNLVCTGKIDTTALPLIQQTIAELGLEDQSFLLGPIPRALLERLFGAARFLIHPSKFEGLGLPLVEAMNFDLAIVASNATCIPEVVGDAALLFDPEDPRAIAAALKQAMDSPALLADLRERGRRRLQAFFPSHAQLAEAFVSIYKAAGGLVLDEREQALVAEMTR